MPSLRSLEGKKIFACIPLMQANVIAEYNLHSVETSGIWISGQKLTEYFMEKASRTMLEKTPVFFVPFHQIVVVLAMDEGVQVSDKVLE
jgi:hypothetical protein